jgi:hypothetical protein
MPQVTSDPHGMKCGRSYGQKQRSNAQKSEDRTVIENIVELAKEAGLVGINEDEEDEEWMQSHSKF